MLDRLTHQTIVAGDVERDQTLYARIAYILELLPIRCVHVRLERADARAVPVQAPHVGEPGEIAGEASALDKGIGGEDSVEIVHAQRFVRRRDVHLYVSEGAPVQRREATSRPAVGKEDVVHTTYRPALDVVAISFLS